MSDTLYISNYVHNAPWMRRWAEKQRMTEEQVNRLIDKYGIEAVTRAMNELYENFEDFGIE